MRSGNSSSLWFSNYDPASPDQLEDTDRPWDYDHIFTAAYGQVYNLPQLVREWFASVGNLRIWPLEANRAVGADTKRGPGVRGVLRICRA